MHYFLVELDSTTDVCGCRDLHLVFSIASRHYIHGNTSKDVHVQELSLACTRRGLETPHNRGGSSEELASLLVSIPDRAVSSSLKALQPAAFATQVSLPLCLY